ncbi:MAG: S24/S26 family peptidase [Anaerolineae bacterium]
MTTQARSTLSVSSIVCDSPAFAELSADLLRAGRSVRFRARGVSMAPLVRDGDVLLVQPVHRHAARLGDVLLIRHGPERVLVHRVVGRAAGPEGLHLTLQGDQVAHPDGVIPEVDVLGCVVAIERGGALLEMHRPAMRLLGWLAVLRSRWSVGRGPRFEVARRMVKGLPVFSRYLA